MPFDWKPTSIMSFVRSVRWRGFSGWKRFSFLAGIVVVYLIQRALVQGPANEPRRAEFERSKRITHPAGGVDTRTTVPEGIAVAGNGMVEPLDREIKLGADVSGRIGRIWVQEGQQVKAGDLLMEMDHDVEKAALLAAEADVANAQADYARTIHGLRREDVDASIAEAASAKAKLDDARDSLRRTLDLEKTGAVTVEALQKARDAAVAALNDFRATDARKRAALAGSRIEDIEFSHARLASAIAKRDQAKALLDRLSIRAPIDGKILQLHYRVGEYYNPNNPGTTDPLFVMGDTSRLRVRVDVDERDIAKVHMGADAFVIADAYLGRRFTGKVVEIGFRMGRKNVRTDDPTERIDTKIQEVVILLDNPEGLVPGLRVTAYIK